MKYEIMGGTVPAVEFQLNKNEAIFSQKGGMAWQTEGIDMKTNAHGGWGVYFYEYLYRNAR